MAVRPRFDPSRPLVAARSFTFMGRAYQLGDPFGPFAPEDGVADRIRARQYEARAVNHAEGDQAEQAGQPVEQVTMTGPAGGRYTITAPWLEEPEVVRGKKNAEDRLAELRAEGAPLGFIEGGSAVTVEGGEGGWYEVSAPWLDEPEKVQGREAAEARQVELHEAGEPDSYKGYTLTPGENGWYAITKDGVETDTPVALNVQGEAKAREAIATLRSGEMIEGTALPAEWTPAEQNDDQGGTDDQSGASDQQPPVDQDPGGETEEETDMVEDENKEKPVDGDAPNEPGTNQPNGAEVINDQKVADGTADEANGDDEGDGTTGTVGP